ncbi:cadherin-like domain-containing protein [Microvirga yunnanensis]|uniref:cadherin-like domain-containing protein n=1 Tax=Microvirga yunnanensis TaxID=2953740 RepID=UPI00290578A3|nr:cadherin-like domain-containing protein [Microvirga sp. HBU65207]
MTDIPGTIGNDSLLGSSGDDVISGHDGNDTLVGGTGNDFLDGGAGTDSLLGGDGDDNLRGGTGSDTLDGGSTGTNRDWVTYDGSSSAVYVDLQLGFATDGAGGTDTLTNIEGVTGSDYADTLKGGSGWDWFTGGGGNDTIDGRDGQDVVFYGESTAGFIIDLKAGTAVARDGTQTDALISIEAVNASQGGDKILLSDVDGHVFGHAGADEIYGGAGHDYLNGGTGNDTIDGAGGFNTVSYFEEEWGSPTPTQGVSVNLAGHTATDQWGGLDALSNIQSVRGSNLNDVLIGNDQFNDLKGEAGNDTISGGGGDDNLQGGAGADLLDGGAGSDNADYGGAAAGVAASLANAASNTGEATGDTYFDIEGLLGSNFSDTLTGNGASNYMEGRDGNDTITGAEGDDFLDGGAGTDNLSGGAGSDLLDGGMGSDGLLGGDGDDSLLGGAGNDTIDGGAHGRFGDEVSYDDSPDAVHVDLEAGTASDGWGTTDTLTNVERVIGSHAADILKGDAAENWFTGGAGNDAIDGRDGYDRVFYGYATTGFNIDLKNGTATALDGSETDRLSGIEAAYGTEFADRITLADGGGYGGSGGSGNDTIMGGSGSDFIEGGSGDDTLDGGGGRNTVSYFYDGGPQGVVVNLAMHTAADNWGGHDTLYNIHDIQGTGFDDALTGDDQDNSLQGNAGSDSLDGGTGDDILDGGTGSDTLLGGEGDDDLRGGAGNDTLDGGANESYVDNALYDDSASGVIVDLQAGTANDGWGGTDTLISIEGVGGSQYADILKGDDGDNWFAGEAGNDTIDGRDGHDRVFYGSASTGFTIDLKAGTATAHNGGEMDTLSGIEAIHGSDFDDNIILADGGGYVGFGQAGNDTIMGGSGSDFVSGGAGNDSIDGGGGQDRVTYFYDEGTQGVTVDLAAHTATDNWGGRDTLINIQDVQGSTLNDTLIGDAQENDLQGEAGNDSISGGAGNDNLQGGDGRDTLNGGAGSDFLDGGNGADSLLGGDGDDNFHGGAGNDTLDGGANGPYVDSATYDDSASGVTVDLQAGTASDGWGGTDTLISIEGVTGSSFADALRGTAGENWFTGGDGNDTIDGRDGRDVVFYEDRNSGFTIDLKAGTATARDGSEVDTLLAIEAAHGTFFDDDITLSDTQGYVFARGGNDTVRGGAGNDNLIGGSGNDVLDGGGGINTASYSDPEWGSPPTRGVSVNLALHTATDNWGGRDTLINIQNVRGSDLNDTLTGDGLNNALTGMAGNDTLVGGGGEDFFSGGAGSDTLDGTGAGNSDPDDTDTADYSQEAGSRGVIVNLATGTATDSFGHTDTLVDIEEVRGTASADTFFGGAEGNGNSEAFMGLAGKDTIIGGTGNDKVRYDHDATLGGTNGVTVNLAAGTAVDGFGDTDTLSGIEVIDATRFADTLIGDDADNRFRGLAGNDAIYGGAGADRVEYHRDADKGGSLGVLVNLAAGTATDGFGDTDTLNSIENARGTRFDDTLIGDAGANHLLGDDGSDDLQGGFGNDSLDGGAGNDVLRGGGGNDTLNGGDGAADTVVFSGLRSDYLVSKASDGTITIADKRAGGDGQDLLQGIEFFQFGNGVISLAALNAEPTVSSSRSITITEDVGTGPLAIGAQDVDGGALSYQVKAGSDPARGAVIFDQVGGTFTYVPHANVTGSDTFTIAISDGRGGTVEQVVNVAIMAINDAPVVAGAVSGTATEGAGPSLLNALARASDVDAGTTLSIVNLPSTLPAGVSYDAGARAFVLDPTHGAYQALAAGATTSVTVNYAVSDGTVATPASVSWTVIGTNDAPLGLSLSNATVLENSLNGTVLGSLSASDPDGDTLTYALLDNAGGRFALQGSPLTGYQLVVANGTLLDYEQGASHQVTVRVADPSGAFVDRTFAITVGDVGGETSVGSAGADQIVGGGGSDNLSGGLGNDTLTGGSGSDILSGGAGNDVLYGGTGKDSFVFKHKPNASTNKDVIKDFKVVDDTIRLDNAVFTKVGANGALKSSAFWTNTTGKAHDRDDRILYDKDSGVLYYDPDGTGSAARVAFATISKNLGLTYKDFYII